VAAPRVLLVVAHPVIGAGIETLLKLDGDFEVKRVASLSEAASLREWGAQVALVDGTLLRGSSDVRIGVPAYVLSGSERDGRQLSRKLDDGRGWLRKDATGRELVTAIEALMRGETQTEAGLGTLGRVTIAILCVVVLAVVAYLVWLAAYGWMTDLGVGGQGLEAPRAN
jgi:DNA-binding NarL/FixJ family response regulator